MFAGISISSSPLLIESSAFWYLIQPIYLHRMSLNVYMPYQPVFSVSHRVCRQRCGLVRAGSGLAGLELLEVPVADLHVASVVVHALGEALNCAGAVVVLLLLVVLLLGLDLLGRGLRRAAAEEAAEGVADRGANCDTSSSAGHLTKQTRALRLGRRLLVLLRRRGHGGSRTSLLRRARRGGGGRASRGARGGTAGGTLTRHCEFWFGGW